MKHFAELFVKGVEEGGHAERQLVKCAGGLERAGQHHQHHHHHIHNRRQQTGTAKVHARNKKVKSCCAVFTPRGQTLY